MSGSELRAKLRVYGFVSRVDRHLGLPRAASVAAEAALPPLAELVARAHGHGDYAALWLIEGLGLRVAQLHMSAGLPLPDLRALAPSLPRESLPMLHAGLGLALAVRQLELLGPRPSPRAGADAIESFVRECEALSDPGYGGAALESLGLVLRVFHDHLRPILMPALMERSELRDAVWHGIGRGIYFTPRHFLPAFARPWTALRALAPDKNASSQAFAGLGWALAMVNVRAPSLCARTLATLDEPGRSSALAGMRAALLVRAATTPTGLADRFAAHRPADPEIASLWARGLAPPLGPELEQGRAQGQIGALFHTAK